MRIRLVKARVRALTVATAVALLAGSSACSDEPPAPQTSPPSNVTTRSASPSPSTSTASQSPSPVEPAGNDLAKLPLRRSIDTGSLTVNIEYTTRLPIEDWQAGVRKPVRVMLTAVNRGNRGQNIYLQRATADVTAYDDNGLLERPEPVIDAATITPGFIVRVPNTYNQVFTLPAVDDAAQRLTIDFTYELTVQVSNEREFGDYAKQVATDTIEVPLS